MTKKMLQAVTVAFLTIGSFPLITAASERTAAAETFCTGHAAPEQASCLRDPLFLVKAIQEEVEAKVALWKFDHEGPQAWGLYLSTNVDFAITDSVSGTVEYQANNRNDVVAYFQGLMSFLSASQHAVTEFTPRCDGSLQAKGQLTLVKPNGRSQAFAFTDTWTFADTWETVDGLPVRPMTSYTIEMDWLALVGFVFG